MTPHPETMSMFPDIQACGNNLSIFPVNPIRNLNVVLPKSRMQLCEWSTVTQGYPTMIYSESVSLNVVFHMMKGIFDVTS